MFLGQNPDTLVKVAGKLMFITPDPYLESEMIRY